ncbi:MAG: segregation/condensation protein A [Gammaproteobacteria bacterium]|jgi:segregation and condensation protein A|nr:segregation/condensation protein A [Gammaproteobacteria bacterium]MBT4145699.1 segregation/condensation protein A [Gammaproteobacteria bacterium]MBT5221294.1 segregation/condensation protein A [Gammaproteobacteria bacterium]MBT5826793.1 segregation/condensation protein A [Gammaproteobacteria bacterium]MBT5967731.1 segregation/condensation protein A [Gammaproteobacteria bacterium]
MEAALDNEAAIAIVSGKPILQLPEDLYIPPEALKVFLEAFEGPLDLLLYLIRKQNLDIVNIPIAQISKQYMRYIDVMSNFQLELAAEYLLMAALLAEIKSRMLLPRQVNPEEEEEDPRAVLVRRLQEYERIKKAAEDLEEIPRMERDIFIATVDTSTVNVHKCQPEVQLQDIVLALQSVLKRVDQLSHHIITKEPLSVRERMALIMGRLEDTSSFLFTRLFTQQEGKAGVVVTFLAILELSKGELIEILQAEPFGELRVRAKSANTA